MFVYMYECVSVNKCVHMREPVVCVWGDSGGLGARKGVLRRGFLLGRTENEEA